MNREALRYSLADFSDSESTDPLKAPRDFTDWMDSVKDARALFQPALMGPPIARTKLRSEGVVRDTLNFSSYNYLGLAHHPRVVEACQRAVSKYGTGAGGSPLLCGMSELHHELEARLVALLGCESVMLFPSGFSGGLGTVAALLRKGDAVVMDEKSHVSLMSGAKLAQAQLLTFNHNDPSSLEFALKRCEGKRRFLVVEGIYSMDGDLADLPKLLEVAERHGVSTFIDEAHSFLACGKKGRGATELLGISPERIALTYGTLSKATASIGGFVGGKADIIEYLRFYASSYGFSCTLPPSVVAGVLAGMDVAQSEPELRERLWENSEYFRRGVQGLGLSTGDSSSYIIPIFVGSDRSVLYELTRLTRERGLFLIPVDYPSVPLDGLRFRASISAEHTREDIDEALNVISDTFVKRVQRTT